MAKDYIYVGESPWGKLGTLYEDNKPRTSQEIIKAADLDWKVGATPMYDQYHQQVDRWHCIYKEDEAKSVIGAVNVAYPKLIQNDETFKLIESMLGNKLEVETCGHVNGNEKVFGCFKVMDQFKLFDDDIDQYLVVLNEHLKVDGKITILYTPIRIVCQNTLAYALNNNIFKVRVAVSPDVQINHQMCYSINDQIAAAATQLEGRSNKYRHVKLERDDVEKFLDDMFPIIEDPVGSHAKANEQQEIARETFLSECMNRPDLNNFRGTGYQLFQASMDFFQHYKTNSDKVYDLTYRMSLLPGQGSDPANSSMKKTITFLNKLAEKQVA